MLKKKTDREKCGQSLARNPFHLFCCMYRCTRVRPHRAVMCTMHTPVTHAGGFADMTRHVSELFDDVRASTSADPVQRCAVRDVAPRFPVVLRESGSTSASGARTAFFPPVSLHTHANPSIPPRLLSLHFILPNILLHSARVPSFLARPFRAVPHRPSCFVRHEFSSFLSLRACRFFLGGASWPPWIA